MSSVTCAFVGVEEFWWFHIGLQLPFGPFLVECKGVSDHLFLIPFLLRMVKMFIFTGKKNSTLFGSENFSTPLFFLLLDVAV